MNRHERRAAKAAARGQPVDRAVAVHEAGHCVARVLVADWLGWDPSEVIMGIDIYPAPVAMGLVSHDATRTLHSQATNWGQFLSKPMHDFLTATMPDTFAALLQGVPLGVSVLVKMRSAGIDVDLWCKAKCIEAVFGPMAEAKLMGKSFDEVWNEESSEADRRNMLRFCRLCGMAPKQIESAYAETIGTAEEYMGRPEVWRAILALADKLKPGRMKGRLAADTICRALRLSEAA